MFISSWLESTGKQSTSTVTSEKRDKLQKYLDYALGRLGKRG
jgi:hypothetical protein